jgi:hypothetical protein
MNYFDPYSSYPDQTIAAAWDSQVTEVAQAPWLAEVLILRGSDLFPLFAACYAELRALPRGVRRALQRQVARSRALPAIFPEWLQKGGGSALQHKLARSLAGAALLLALLQGATQAATITVTINVTSINADGQCSLIEAIVNANNDAATHPDCPAGNGADMIVLPTDTHTVTGVNNDTYGPSGLPVITSQITISGNGATIVRRGRSAFRLITVSHSGDLTLQNMTLSKGNSSYWGGGAAFNSGTLAIESSTISGNTADGGGGVKNFGALTITDSTISDNRAHGAGGVYNKDGMVIIQNSTISGNTAAAGGGGVANFSDYFPSIVTIRNSTISGNHAESGGGVQNVSFYYENYSSLTITNSTISGNKADEGGGVYNNDILNLKNSLTAGNTAGVGAEISNSGSLTADNFNLFGANGNAGVTGFTPGLSDIVPARGVKVKNILAPLKNNGGSTQTHALVPGSPALDVVSLLDPACAGTDQRGVDRPQGPGCDIGAFEENGP